MHRERFLSWHWSVVVGLQPIQPACCCGAGCTGRGRPRRRSPGSSRCVAVEGLPPCRWPHAVPARTRGWSPASGISARRVAPPPTGAGCCGAGLDPIQPIHRPIAGSGAQLLRRRQGAAPVEHGQLPEQFLLWRAEQVIAPGQRLSHGALTCRDITTSRPFHGSSLASYLPLRRWATRVQTRSSSFECRGSRQPSERSYVPLRSARGAPLVDPLAAIADTGGRGRPPTGGLAAAGHRRLWRRRHQAQHV